MAAEHVDVVNPGGLPMPLLVWGQCLGVGGNPVVEQDGHVEHLSPVLLTEAKLLE